MTDTSTLPAPVADADGAPGFAQRLEQLETFANQVSGAIDQLVSAVVDVQQAKAGDALSAEVEGMRTKLRELEQQLSLERACRDLAQVSRMHPKARVAVFVGTTYFGCNVKYAWAAAREQAQALDLEVWFLPYNAEQERLVTGLGGHCFPVGHANWTPGHLHTALSAAVVVTTDHFLNPNPYAAALLAGARHVQLWHGVSIKEIGLRNLAPGRALGPHFAKVLATCGPYATMLGTAAQGEIEWRRWFSFHRYAPLGYPRNDVLYRQPTEADLAGCDRDTYDRARATLARGKRVLLYAPTFRDGRPDWVLHAGLDKLAQAAAQGGDLLVVNLHPVESPQIPKLAPQLPGVAFVEPRTDLYPLLGQVSALITDYSSVMFDFLHVDRPVLLFRPDHAAYTQKSRKLFDDKLAVLPGPLFDDAAALAKALRRSDLGQTAEHAAARAQLRASWFDHHDGDSAQRLLAVIDDELGLACAVAAASSVAPAADAPVAKAVPTSPAEPARPLPAAPPRPEPKTTPTATPAAVDFASLSTKTRKRPLVLFFGRSTFSDNSKYLYLRALAGARGYEVLWCAQDGPLAEQLAARGLPCLAMDKDPQRTLDTLLHAGVAVFTVNPFESVGLSPDRLACLAGAAKVQLWHGISVKHLNLQLLPHAGPQDAKLLPYWLANCGADHLLSTASHFDGFWRDAFGCRSLIRAGQPRNEVLVRPAEGHEWLGAELPDRARRALESGRPAVLVAPTWQRDKATELLESEFLARAVLFARQHRVEVFFKVHPTYAGHWSADTEPVEGLHLLDPGVDLYPWLSRFKALVTDYSSIAFDFLLTGRPVLTLDIDSQSHHRFEPDWSLLPPGRFSVPFRSGDFDACLSRALDSDTEASLRKDFAAQLFETDPSRACDALLQALDTLVEQSQARDHRVWAPGR